MLIDWIFYTIKDTLHNKITLLNILEKKSFLMSSIYEILNIVLKMQVLRAKKIGNPKTNYNIIKYDSILFLEYLNINRKNHFDKM